MTGSNDLDRQLAGYLDEGPQRAPERAVEAAIAFAAAHPRRPDPLRFLKGDVMPRRRTLVAPQLAWAVLLIVLALGAVAALAVGGRLNQAPVIVPPSVVDSPSPSSPPTPSAPPSATPSAPAGPGSFDFEVADALAGLAYPISVDDASGSVLDAASEGMSPDEPVDRISAIADPADPLRILLTWNGCADQVTQQVTIDATGRTWRVERPECGDDTIGIGDLQIGLTFAEPVDPATLDVRLVETPR